MAKFKNIHSESGKLTFEDQRIEFFGELKTENESLIKALSENPNWIEIKSENDLEEDLEKLKKEAKELGVKFNKNISFDKLKEKIDEFKANQDDEVNEEDENDLEVNEENDLEEDL